MNGLPQEYLNIMQQRLGEEFPAFLASYGRPPAKGLRVNTLKISSEELIKRLPFPVEGPVPWAKDCFYLEAEKPGADPLHFAGLYYMQEPSAMSVGGMSEGLPMQRVLDLCAAPGGKSTHIASLMAGKGILVSNEIDPARAAVLRHNLERMGVRNAAVTSASPARLAALLPSFFDLILVDAPCSGEGMFKKEEGAIPAWSMENMRGCAARQREILESAATMLAPGGHLLYSTCTFSEEEDGEQISAFLDRHRGFTLVKEETLWPHRVRGEGHYAALLKGPAEPVPCPVRRFTARRDRAAEKAFCAFAKDFFTAPPEGEIATLADGRMYLVPADMPPLNGVRLLRLGVELGEWDGKIFKPAHALAMALKRENFSRFVSLSREGAERYLRGETVESGLGDGWCAVGVEEFPLGLGKCVGGVVKNHLPKGLRKVK